MASRTGRVSHKLYLLEKVQSHTTGCPDAEVANPELTSAAIASAAGAEAADAARPVRAPVTDRLPHTEPSRADDGHPSHRHQHLPTHQRPHKRNPSYIQKIS